MLLASVADPLEHAVESVAMADATEEKILSLGRNQFCF